MNRINKVLLMSFACLGLQSINAAEICVTTGTSLKNTKKSYASSCEIPIQDCDLFNGLWYCASENINASDIQRHLRHTESPAQHQSARPPVSENNSCTDSDGDGWGWDGTDSCRVSVDTQSIGTSNSHEIPSASECIDSDGDGWGWDGIKSCRVESGLTDHMDATSNRLDTNTEVPGVASQRHCSGSHPSDISDLILVTGQSNVTGARTEVAATLDQWGKVVRFKEPDNSHQRVFAWTVDPGRGNAGTGWKVASLTQSWHDNNPGVGGIAHNSFPLHFAKKVADQDGCRVVGLIVVSEPGRGISHWDYSAPGWNEVVTQVNEAMSAIGRTSIDGILWHQGESDWIVDGTCYGSLYCQNQQPDYYAQKLYSGIADSSVSNPVGRFALLDRLRDTEWFDEGKPFIAGETAKAPVNALLNKLNMDDDPWTACISSDAESGIETQSDGIHFSANGLREIGARYADAYLNMTRD